MDRQRRALEFNIYDADLSDTRAQLEQARLHEELVLIAKVILSSVVLSLSSVCCGRRTVPWKTLPAAAPVFML